MLISARSGSVALGSNLKEVTKSLNKLLLSESACQVREFLLAAADFSMQKVDDEEEEEQADTPVSEPPTKRIRVGLFCRVLQSAFTFLPRTKIGIAG